MLKGTYTLGIICEPYPDTLFAVKYGTLLVVALDEEEFFFAFDIPALLPYQKKSIFLKDGQMCILKRDGPEPMSLDSLHGGKGRSGMTTSC